MKRYFILTLALLCAAAAAAADYKVDRDLVYRSDDEYAERMCRLDVSSPEGAKGAPVIVWFHGGGLTGGGKDTPRELLESGAVVVGAGYRLSPEVKVETIIDDAACAVAWVFANIEKYGGDPDRIYISGHSAGGYLVSMIGLDKSRLARYGIDADRLRGIVPFSGQAITHFGQAARGRQSRPALPRARRCASHPHPLGRPRDGDAGPLRGERLSVAHVAPRRT